MKVALVTTNAPPLLGGLERVTLRIAQYLKETGDEAWIVARFTQDRRSLRDYFRESEAPGESVIEGVTTRTIGPANGMHLAYRCVFPLIWRKSTFPWARRLTQMCLGRQVAKACRGADVIHYLGSGPEMLGFAAAWAARKLGLPFLVEPALHPGQWGDSWIDYELYLQAERLLAHTEAEAAVMEKMGISNRNIRTIISGVDPACGGDGQRFRAKHAVQGPMILFLGRKTKAKGVERLLEAFSVLKEEFPDTRLVFAGPEDKNTSIPSEPHILNLDRVSESEKQDALAACDIFCVPSEGESFGMVYFEAWAYAKPVIGLDLPALRCSIGQSGGGLLARTDPESLNSALRQLLKDPEQRKTMGVKGHQHMQRHTWQNAINSYRACYRECVENTVQ